MRQKVFSFFFLFQCLLMTSAAQEYKTKFQLKEGESFGINPLDNSFKHQAIPVFSNDTQHILLMMSTSGTLQTAYLRKSNLAALKTVSANIPEVKELNTLVGGFQFDSLKYVAIFNSKKEDSFSAFEIDLHSDSIVSTDFSLRLKNEKILHTFSAKEKFYIVTIVSRSSTIKIYKVFRSQRGTISLSEYSYDFSSSDQDKTLPNLYKELMEFTFRGSQELVKFMIGKPVSLAATGSNFKLYTSDEKVVLTMDHVHGRTSVYEMFLDSNLKEFQLLSYPDYIINNPYLYTSNSILRGDSLIQLAISKEDLAVILQDRQNNEILQEYTITALALDSIASQLVYRDESVGKKRKSKVFTNIYKDIYKNQIGFIVYDVTESGISCRLGTTRPLLQSKSLQTEEFISFQQSMGDGLSAFSFRIALDESNYSEQTQSRAAYETLIDYKTKNKIKQPLIESLISDGNFFYYCWYSIFTSEVIVKKIAVQSGNSSY